jgi:hypothetical protein
MFDLLALNRRCRRLVYTDQRHGSSHGGRVLMQVEQVLSFPWLCFELCMQIVVHAGRALFCALLYGAHYLRCRHCIHAFTLA